jgi:hypothetical protein
MRPDRNAIAWPGPIGAHSLLWIERIPTQQTPVLHGDLVDEVTSSAANFQAVMA